MLRLQMLQVLRDIGKLGLAEEAQAHLGQSGSVNQCVVAPEDHVLGIASETVCTQVWLRLTLKPCTVVERVSITAYGHEAYTWELGSVTPRASTGTVQLLKNTIGFACSRLGVGLKYGCMCKSNVTVRGCTQASQSSTATSSLCKHGYIFGFNKPRSHSFAAWP